MAHELVKKTWVSPIVGFAFAAVAFTGILMLLHVKNGSIMVIHEWLGFLFAVAGLLHLCLNWKCFCGYLRGRTAQLLIVLMVIIAIGLGIGGQFRQHPLAAKAKAMAPLKVSEAVVRADSMSEKTALGLSSCTDELKLPTASCGKLQR